MKMYDRAVTLLDLSDEPISRHTQLHSLTWDPQTHDILYLSNESGSTALWTYALSTKSRRALTEPELNVTRFWLVDEPGVRLVVACDPDSTEREQLFLLRNDGALTPWIEAADSYHYFAGCLIDGEGVYLANAASETHHRIMRTGVSTGEPHELASIDAVLTSALTLSPHRLLLLEERTNIDRRFCLFDTDTGTLTALAAGQGRIAQMRRLSEGAIIFSGDLGGERIGLHTLDLGSGAVRTIFERPNQDVQEFCLHPPTGRIAIALRSACASQILITALDAEGVAQALTGDAVHLHSMCFIGPDDLLTVTSSPFGPPEVQLHSLENLEQRPALSCSAPLDCAQEVDRFTSFDGRDIEFVFLGRPDSRQAIIYLHGGPESIFERSHSPILESLVKSGVAVIAPNIRGSEGYGRAFISLDDGEKRLDALNDVIALREHLYLHYGLGQGQVGIMGHSYGGFMTLLAITHHPTLWSHAVSIAGMSHLGNFLKTAPAWRRRLREMEYGDAASHGDFFDLIAPLTKVADIRCPVLILHGDSDTRVPTSESSAMAKALTRACKDHEMRWIAGEGHFLTKRTSTEAAAEAILDFIKSTTKKTGETGGHRAHLHSRPEAT